MDGSGDWFVRPLSIDEPLMLNATTETLYVRVLVSAEVTADASLAVSCRERQRLAAVASRHRRRSLSLTEAEPSAALSVSLQQGEMFAVAASGDSRL